MEGSELFGGQNLWVENQFSLSHLIQLKVLFLKSFFFFLIYLLGCAKLSLQHASSLVVDGNS